MTNRKRFFYNGILLTLVGLAMRSVGMFFGALVSRAVGAEGVGLYTLIMTVYSFAVTLATSGIGLTVTRHVAAAIGEGDTANVGRIMRGAFLYSAIFGILSFSLLFFGADLIGNLILHESRTVASFKILAFSLLPNSISAAIGGYFVGVKRVASNAAVQVISNVFKIGITVLLLTKYVEQGITQAVYAVCLGITLTEILSLTVLLLQYIILRIRDSRHGCEIRPVVKTAVPLALSAYIRSALLTIEHILIPKKLTERMGSSDAALADYGTLHGMALPLVMYPMAPLTSFSGLLVPEFAESAAAGQGSRLKRICSESISATLTYAIAVAVFLSLFSEELGYVIYNSHDAGKFIALLAPVVPIMYLDHVTDSMLKGIGEQVYSMWVNIADSALSVVLVVILIPRMGISGYAVVIIIMEAFNFVLSLSRLRHRIKFGIPVIKSILAPATAALIASVITKELFLMNGSATTVLWLVLKIIFAACIFIALNVTFTGATKLKRTAK